MKITENEPIKCKACCQLTAFLHTDLYKGFPGTENSIWRIECENCGHCTTMGTKEQVIRIWQNDRAI